MVTSATHRRWDGDIEIDDLADAGLPSGSIVRSAEIATIEAADAVAIGRLSLADQHAPTARCKVGTAARVLHRRGIAKKLEQRSDIRGAWPLETTPWRAHLAEKLLHRAAWDASQPMLASGSLSVVTR